ncbi:MAG TPA: AAA family ATPase [Solirubrobacteraceae bacterium]|nr:AAA family ATPase [Solirubrobacteraceae bacterium]
MSLPGLDAHPHAQAVLLPALRFLEGEEETAAGGREGGGGRGPTHAYLFHGPPGVGKRTVARAFAATLLAAGAPTPEEVRGRVERGAHPDLTWVTPSGAGEMLVGDIDQAVVAAAARTPFESRRRVFVLEDAHTLNDQAANRLLKTLEEPPPFAHLILLAPTPRELLPTIASRCQQVRFDPLPPARIEERLREERLGADDATLAACARLGLGDARLANRLAGEWGSRLRERVEAFVRGAVSGDTAGRPWLELLQAARDAGTSAGEELAARVAGELELLPAKERKRHEREAVDAQRRAERRARGGALDLALRLAQLWLRDVWCVAEGAGELVYALDRRPELERDAAGRSPARLREAVELVRDTRLRLTLNVSEELALESLAYRLQALLAGAGSEVV